MTTTKRVKLSDESAAESDPAVFQALDHVQQKLDQITDQRSDEILAVEKRYNEIRRPVYLERNKLMRDVPDLWLQCLLQHQQIAELVTERDTELLSFLEEVDVEDFPDIKSGYKITFTFKDNPFFKNQRLVKELHYADDNALAVQGTDIEWTEAGLQHQEQAQQELMNGRKRKAQDSTSFFDWFWDSGSIPEGNEPISDLIKDELWTNPMRGSGDDVQMLTINHVFDPEEYMQDIQGLEPGSDEEDGGMYIEEQDIEQYDYTDDAAGQEGVGEEDDEAENDPQEGSMQTDTAEADLQDEGDPSEQEDPAEGEPADGLDDDDEEAEAEAAADYPDDEEAEVGAAAEDEADLGTNGAAVSPAPGAQDAPPGLLPNAKAGHAGAATDSTIAQTT